MKKMSFLLMMLMLGLSTALWTACSDDDDKEDGQEQGGGNEGGEDAVVKDTTWVLKTIKMNDLDNAGFYKQVTLTRNAEGAVTEMKIGKYTPDGTENGNSVTYPITPAVNGKLTISFDDENMGETMKHVYTLNAKGYVANVQRMYAEDGEVLVEYKFEYNDKDQLVQIDMVYDGEEISVFKATYSADGNWQTCMMAPDDGEGELIGNCTVSTLKNNYSSDLNLLMLTDDYSYYDSDLVQCAVYLGLLPVTPNVIASVSVDGQNIAVVASENNKRIATLKMDPFIDLVLTTDLKETEKK